MFRSKSIAAVEALESRLLMSGDWTTMAPAGMLQPPMMQGLAVSADISAESSPQVDVRSMSMVRFLHRAGQINPILEARRIWIPSIRPIVLFPAKTSLPTSKTKITTTTTTTTPTTTTIGGVAIAPGSQVTGRTVTINGLTQLLILGTDQADTITLSQSGSQVTLSSQSGTQVFSGVAGALVYGFGGNDTIMVNSSVTVPASIYGGDGDDTIYCYGQGADTIDGGAGNDLILSVGGGAADTIKGGSGLSSFWVDAGDTLTGVTAAETAATGVHRIANFYQPYTTSSADPQYVPFTIAGQSLADPTPTSAGYTYRTFNKPLFVDGPEYSDIAQGYVGDCYFLASLAALSQSNPAQIRQMVVALGDGTYAVRFYRNGSPVYVRVDGDLAVTGSGGTAYAGFGADGEMWVPVVEKAYAFFRGNAASYASISGGWMGEVYSQVVNSSGGYATPASLGANLYTYVSNQLAAGHAVTMGSFSSASGPIVGNHAYMVKSAYTDGAGQHIQVYNPWGVDGGSATDASYYDGLVTLTPAQVTQFFSAVVACAA